MLSSQRTSIKDKRGPYLVLIIVLSTEFKCLLSARSAGFRRRTRRRLRPLFCKSSYECFELTSSQTQPQTEELTSLLDFGVLEFCIIIFFAISFVPGVRGTDLLEIEHKHWSALTRALIMPKHLLAYWQETSRAASCRCHKCVSWAHCSGGDKSARHSLGLALPPGWHGHAGAARTFF